MSFDSKGIRTPAFRALLRIWLISLLGDGIRVTVLPIFTAISTNDPLAVSLVAIAEVLPWLVIALPAGAVVDRFSPRSIVFLAHVCRAAATAGLAILIALGHADVVALVIFAFVVTSVQTFADAAEQVLLVELAGSADLERANSWLVTAQTIGLDLAGPLIVGLAFSAQPAADTLNSWPSTLCFAVSAATFVVSSWKVLRLPNVAAQRLPSHEQPNRSIAQFLQAAVLEGSQFLLRDKYLRMLMGVVMITAFAISAVNAMVALFVVQTLAAPPVVLSVMLIVLSLSTLAAARVTPWLSRRLGDGRVMVGALCLTAAGLTMVGLVPAVATAVLGYLVTGFGTGAWNVLSASQRQRSTPGSLVGRVSSAYRVFTWGLMPLGAGLAGPLAVLVSLRGVFIACGVLIGLTVAASVRSLLAVR